MSKKGNKIVIGVFVIGALVLLLIGIVVFGSGELFKRTNKFVLYFDGSVKLLLAFFLGFNTGANWGDPKKKEKKSFSPRCTTMQSDGCDKWHVITGHFLFLVKKIISPKKCFRSSVSTS